LSPARLCAPPLPHTLNPLPGLIAPPPVITLTPTPPQKNNTNNQKKVCNHPDLFEGRPIVSAYDMPRLSLRLPSLAAAALPHRSPWERLAAIADGAGLPGLLVTAGDARGAAAWEGDEIEALAEGVGAMMVRPFFGWALGLCVDNI
jgi:hypothetical protein